MHGTTISSGDRSAVHIAARRQLMPGDVKAIADGSTAGLLKVEIIFWAICGS